MKILHSNILGEGKPLIILHGFLGMSDNWKTLGNKFSQHGLQVHLVDQRNHGRSFHSDEFNYELLAEDLKHYIDYHKLNEILVLGHSMGGKTAMMFAVTYPEFVSKLIVADISPRYYPVHHQTILEGLTALKSVELKSRGQADKIMQDYVSDFGTRQFLLKNLYWKDKGVLDLRINLEALKDNVEEVGEPLPVHSKFEKPTLFLRGDRSEYISQQDESIIQRHFTDSKIVTISNSGHWLHAENPEDFFEAVIQFVK